MTQNLKTPCVKFEVSQCQKAFICGMIRIIFIKIFYDELPIPPAVHLRPTCKHRLQPCRLHGHVVHAAVERRPVHDSGQSVRDIELPLA